MILEIFICEMFCMYVSVNQYYTTAYLSTLYVSGTQKIVCRVYTVHTKYLRRVCTSGTA